MFSKKRLTNLRNFATKDKTKKIADLRGGGEGLIQLFNAKISPNYVSFISL
jgi:hypothetical protein